MFTRWVFVVRFARVPTDGGVVDDFATWGVPFPARSVLCHVQPKARVWGIDDLDDFTSIEQCFHVESWKMRLILLTECRSFSIGLRSAVVKVTISIVVVFVAASPPCNVPILFGDVFQQFEVFIPELTLVLKTRKAY